MKGFSIALFAGVAAIAICLSIPATSRAELETSGNITYVSKYIWRGWDLAPNEEPALQGGISVAHPVGLALDIWGSYAFDGDPALDEFDYTLGYSFAMNDFIDASLGMTYYTFPSASHSESAEVYLGLSFPKAALGPAFTVYHDWEDGDGTYYLLEFGHDFIIDQTGAAPPLSLYLAAGYNDEQWGTTSGFSDIDIGLSMTFTAGTVDITPSLTYVIVPEDTINPDNQLWFGVDFGFSL